MCMCVCVCVCVCDVLSVFITSHWPSHRYIYCPKCFQEIPGDMVTVGDDPTSRTVIPKSHFKELKNDVIEHEP